MCWLFHKWTKWEQYTENGTAILGRIAPKDQQGLEVPYTEHRQTRYCTRCGKVQDKFIRDGLYR